MPAQRNQPPSPIQPKDARLRVALNIESSGAYGRGFLRGIAKYAHLHGPWSFHFVIGDSHHVVPDFEKWEGDGFIGRITSPSIERLVQSQALPFVALDLTPEQADKLQQLSMAEIHPDAAALAANAIEHYQARGYQQIAFLGRANAHWSDLREAAIKKRIEADSSLRFLGAEHFSYEDEQKSGWEKRQAIGQWLTRLPQPIGVIACNDDIGRVGLEAAMHMGIQVPDEIAFLGIDNDETICELCDPPLSSVQVDSETAGFEAAQRLHALIKGKRVSKTPLLAQPTLSISRRSTDTFAIEDEAVSAALRFIRDNANRSLGVDAIASVSGVSRRILEQRFKKFLRRTIHQEIERARIGRAKQLLLSTTLPIEEIALDCGYSSSSHFSSAFKRILNDSPASYRKKRR